MKTDLYLKIVLTVIAVSLTILVFQNSNIKFMQTANANATDVQFVNPQQDKTTGVMNVNIVSINGKPISAIPVTVSNTPSVRMESGYGSMDVRITNTPSVKVESDGYRGLNVNVTNTPNVKVEAGYGGLDVNVKNYRDFK